MKRPVIIGLVVFAVSASPAWANNDPTVPGDNCSGNGTAVGHSSPFGVTVNAVNIGPSPIAPPASKFTAADFAGDFPTGDFPADPAAAGEGAMGQAKSAAVGNCKKTK